MSHVFLSLRDVRTRVPRSRSTIYSEISQSIFPRPIEIGRGSYWRADEIDKLMAAYSAGANTAELRQLCNALHENRGGAHHGR